VTEQSKQAYVPPGPEYPPTLPNLIANMVSSFGDRDFLIGVDQRSTFAETDRQAADLALGLLGLGLGKGSRIGILMPNNPEWVISWLAAGRIGAHAVLLSTFYQAGEIRWALRHNDLNTLLISDRYLKADYPERLERAIPQLSDQESTTLYLKEAPYLRHIVVWGETNRPWAMHGPDELLQIARKNPVLERDFLDHVEQNVTPADDLVTICTSGSSAEPKAVVHTHGVTIRAVCSFLDYLDFQGTDCSYSGQPFFWIGGLNVNLIPCMLLGASLAFSATPDPKDILEVIEKEQVSRVSLWPAQVRGLSQLAARGGRDVSSVRTGLGPRLDEYGQAIPSDRLVSSGGGVGLGMTESFGMHSMEKTTNVTPLGKGGNWGRHLPGMERRIVDPETGLVLPPGVEGELYIRGFAMMRGYYKVEREDTFTRDGFFATGDRCVIDEDDYLFFHGRLSEMIKTSGANVAPREVELVIQARPEVREAIVFGMPDEVKGEIVACVVVPAIDDDPLDIETLRAAIGEEISPYKVPQEFVVMAFEEIPRTGSAKAHKPKLRDAVAQQLRRTPVAQS
jgi:acyl-coenzyme A synthetase/AMP-(fatty) acid ligase